MLVLSRNDFIDCFSGNVNAYGQYVPPSESATEGSKEEGGSFTKSELINDFAYAEHLAGRTGLGIIPVTEQGLCRFSVIDVDSYEPAVVSHIISLVYEYEFPIVPFRSKSGGLHLYTFYEEFCSAKDVRAAASYMRMCLGLPESTEIFPKQDKIEKGKQGSWINLPYFGGDESQRCIINEDGTLLKSFDRAVHTIVSKRITKEKYADWKEALPLTDAPPCLQAIYMAKETSSRNNYLFNIACYYKAKYKEDFIKYVEEANARLSKPISDQELKNTIISSISKNEYTYRCKEPPICDLCDKKECRTRAYTVGDAVSKLTFENLKQYTTDPPYYEWTVSGKVLRFYSEQEIILQERFRALCMRNIGFLPQKMKQEKWTDLVNAALLHMEVVQVDPDEEITDQGEIRALVVKFLKETRSDQISRLLLGRSYYKQEAHVTYFRGPDLIKYVTTRLGSHVNKMPLYAWLTEKGVYGDVIKVTGKATRVYVVPDGALYEEEVDGPSMLDEKQMEVLNFSSEEKEAY